MWFTKQLKNNGRAVLPILWMVLITLDIAAIFGVSQLEFGHGLDQVFSGGGQRYADYSNYLESSGITDGVLILIEGEDLAEPAAFSALTDLVLDLQLMPGVEEVLSPFSIPIPMPDTGVVTLDVLSDNPVLAWQRAHETQPALSRVLAEDRSLALITLLGVQDLQTIAEIDAFVLERLAQSGLHHKLTGLPAVLERSGSLLLQDFLRLNVIGAALGMLIVALALRGWWISLTTVLSSGTALLWGIGTLGWLGIEVTVISIALPILILVLSLSDAVHLGLEQGTLLRGNAAQPVRETLVRIGPAVLLTSVTTAIALFSLQLSGSAAISEMGRGGALAVLAASFGVIFTSGVLAASAVAVLGRERLTGQASMAPRQIFNWFWLAHIGIKAERALVPTSVVLIAAACLAYFFLAEPRFSLHENLRKSDPVLLALELAEAKFGPASALHVVVNLNGMDSVEVARLVSDAVRSEAPELSTLSVVLIAETAEASGMEFAELIDPLSPRLRNRFDGSETGQIVIDLPFGYENSRQTRNFAKEVEARLAVIQNHGPTPEKRVTGAEVMSAFVSYSMIHALSLSLLLSMGAVGLIIAFWLRSFKAGILALVANLLPIAFVGATLGLSGIGISFAAGIALTLAFGVAVDDTIHVMNRYRLTSAQSPERLQRAMKAVTTPIVITSLVLVAGLSGTLRAALPTVEEFGILAMAVFLLALLADLVFLPALLKRYPP